MGNEYKEKLMDRVLSEWKEIHYSRNILPLLPDLIEKCLPLRKAILYFKEREGNQWVPFCSSGPAGEPPPLKEESVIIDSFTNTDRFLFLNQANQVRFKLFDEELNGILKNREINIIFPLHAREYYRGILLAEVTKKKSNVLQKIDQSIRSLFFPLIAMMEAEELELRSDRAYYRLFKFDRLVLLGQMAASLAHELRTPLSTILFEISEIRSLLEESAEALLCHEKISREIQRANHMIESLLVFSKFKEMKREVINLKDFIPTALQEIPSMKLKPSVILKTDLRGDVFTCTDPQRLRQVLFNIIFNAIESIPDKGSVKIKVYQQSAERPTQRYAVISIIDNGSGIAENLKEKVLEPFFTTKKEGTGLGLYIAYGIMKSLKGELEIQSSNRGTMVNLLLPGEEHSE